MRTRLTIVGLVVAAAAAAVGVVVLLVNLLGALIGLAASVLGAATLLAAYRRWVQPWQHRWARPTRRSGRPCPATSWSRGGQHDPGHHHRGRPRGRLALAGAAASASLAADPGHRLLALLSDPGAFIMERRMLKGIKARVERTAVRLAA
jgi:hypothetical protein